MCDRHSGVIVPSMLRSFEASDQTFGFLELLLPFYEIPSIYRVYCIIQTLGDIYALSIQNVDMAKASCIPKQSHFDELLKPLKTLNPCCMNMNVARCDPRNANSCLKFGENRLDDKHSQRLHMCDKRSIYCHPGEFQQSFKKPRISESTTDSSSRMSNSSASRSKQARPTKDFSQPCLKFRRGKCNYGDACIFAHDEIREARKSLYPFRGIVAEEQRGMIVGHKLCRYFMNGQTCPYGRSCHFTHHKAKDVKGGSGVHRDSAAVAVAVAVVDARDIGGENRKGFDETESERVKNLHSDASQIELNNMVWKTRLCRKWEIFGSCPYGLKCHYAHGVSELRKLGAVHQLESGKFFRMENVAVEQEKAASTKKAIGTSSEGKEKSKRCLVKLDSVTKINCIYADWIESVPPVPVISGSQ